VNQLAKSAVSQGAQKRTRRIKLGISVGLCLAMVFSMAGCKMGGKKDTVETVSADTPYYAVKELDFYKAPEGENVQVLSMTICKDQAAFLVGVYSNDDTSLNGLSLDYLILLYDKTGKQTAQIDLGNVIDLSLSIISMSCDADGHFFVLAQGQEAVTHMTIYRLYSIDSEGVMIGEPAAIVFSDESYLPIQMVIDNAGNIYISGHGKKYATINVFDRMGNRLFESKDANLNGGVYLIGDTVYADSSKSEENSVKYFMYPINSDTGNFGDPMEMTSILSTASPVAGADKLFASNTTGIYSFDLDSKEKREVLVWKDTAIEVSIYSVGQVIVLSEDAIFCLGYSYSSTASEVKLALLTPQAENPNVGKQIITMAGVGISDDPAVQKAVYEFNNASTEYRIEVQDFLDDYDVSTTEGAYSAAVSEMNKTVYMEMLSGEGPDIIYGSSGMSFSLYESKGLLVDLYTLMEKDSTFNKEDYLPNIMNLCEKDGHLYKMPTGFLIQGFGGTQSVIGERIGWTVDEFNKMVNSLPSGVMPLANLTQSDLITGSLNESMDSFVDMDTLKANFDSDEFCQLMNFAKLYGRVDNGDMENGEIYVDEQTLAKNGELALTYCYISDPSSYNQTVTIFGEPVSIVGFPSSTKTGPLCYAGAMFAISSESANPAAAWEFVKTFISADAQKTVSENSEIPVMTTVFEEQIGKALNPEASSATDNGVVVDYTLGSETMSEESAQAYRDLVNNLDTLYTLDQDILAIVLEEVPAYFNDQKTAKEVAGIIQNRAQTLVDERGK